MRSWMSRIASMTVLLCAVLVLAFGCSSTSGETAEPEDTDDIGDTGGAVDTGADTGSAVDTGADTGLADDAGDVVDTGLADDAGDVVDTGLADDAGDVPDIGDASVPVVVPQCITSGYQAVFRGLVEPLWVILRYMDTPVALREASQLPPIENLTELSDVPDVYARFTWNVDDVPGVTDTSDTLVTADFIEGGEMNLDLGIFNGNVVLIDWDMTVDVDTEAGAGKFSVVGLDNDTVRMTIVDFNPWYDAYGCQFEVFNFSLHLDISTTDSEPFAIVVGYSAEGTGYAIENGWIIFAEGQSANFSGDFVLGDAAAVPFDFDLDYSTDPATIDGTFGGAPASCTIDLATFEVSC